ncbi:hypothetical protein GGR50DRAFT_702392 [Xylaria sp. CBS 124048]|nr:hypothetical protein GGR50DRAFT_702392 [Xylaria sp. CBS 124048]
MTFAFAGKVPNMFIRGPFRPPASGTLNIQIGYERDYGRPLKDTDLAQFNVHESRLGPLYYHLQRTHPNHRPEDMISEVTWEVETFNLAMAWSHGMPVPRVEDLSRYFDPKEYPVLSLDIPNKKAFVPEAVKLAMDANMLLPQGIAGLGDYAHLSAEEMRLYATENPQHLTANAGSQKDVARRIKERNKLFTELNNASNRSSIPFQVPTGEAKLADRQQIELLKLMIFAEKYKWDSLFNDAADAFFAGEGSLRRLFLPDPYFELVLAEKAVRLTTFFMVDHALTLAFKSKRLYEYADIMLYNPDFASFMVSRMDAIIPVGVYGDYRMFWEDTPAGICDVVRAYHAHDGMYCVNCRCRIKGH